MISGIRYILQGLLIVFCQTVWADFEGEIRDWDERGWRGQVNDVAPISNPLYKELCGRCHFAYQAGLLPERSWRALLANLNDHFGESVKLEKQQYYLIDGYLSAAAADFAEQWISVELMETLGDEEVPLRITETPFFQERHAKLEARHVEDNSAVGSLSRCEVCHRQAAANSFNIHEVIIPGFGIWAE
jgi:hypothetical protein